jgi:molecular chaperone DnaK
VALGASISAAAMAGEKSKAILVDIASHSLGIEALGWGEFGEQMVFSPIIHRNTPLPVSKSEPFSTNLDNQQSVSIGVFEGENSNAKLNSLIGEFNIEGLSKVPRGNLVVVNFNLDLNGMLKVTATEKLTGLTKAVTLDTRGARSSLDLTEARRNIQSLLQSSEEAEPLAIEEQAAGDHQEALQAAKDLRKRADALIGKGIGADDAAEIREFLQQSAEAIKVRNWPRLTELSDSLSDLLFYLED